MKKLNLFVRSALSALAVSVYVIFIAWLVSNGDRLFAGNSDMFGAATFLLLFVISATITGYLILGKPLLLYLDNSKKEALKLFYLTISCLLFIAVLALICLAVL
ncbi:hypothetical protein K9M09_00520 [Patescibacteria group bacterium]|nr:hypothetical protein [Patescibacteria group bacterium]